MDKTSIKEWCQKEECTDSEELQYDFDTSCLASLVVGSFKDQGAYTATVYVFDHLGQYLDTWTQQFGYCEEFENEDRPTLTNIDNFLLMISYGIYMIVVTD
ncbi:MAG: hypothetical protein OCD01_18950 [Fibrobacterales bacterium]